LPRTSTRLLCTLVVSSKLTCDCCARVSLYMLTSLLRPQREHTELEEELHEKAHIDYDRVAIVRSTRVNDIETVADNVLQVANPSVAALYEDALVYETGSAITSSGALSAYSGAKTGRSPSDKRIVKEGTSDKDVWWGPVNKPMEPNVRFGRRAQQSPCISDPLPCAFDSWACLGRTWPNRHTASRSRGPDPTVCPLASAPHRKSSGLRRGLSSSLDLT